MSSFFDTENLPSEIGGNATLKYDHEEFSRLMTQSDIKAASYWGIDRKSNHIAIEQVKLHEVQVPEHVVVSPTAS